MDRPRRERPRADEVSIGPMYALLQIYPLEARGDDDPTPLDAIAVDGSQERLEEYLADYQERYRAACAEFAARDPNPDSDWTAEHDCLSEAFMDRHAVYGALMAETTFKIVEVLALDVRCRCGADVGHDARRDLSAVGCTHKRGYWPNVRSWGEPDTPGMAGIT